MPIKRNDWVKKTRRFVNNVSTVTEDTLTEILIIGGAHAAAITPRDTSTLVNSQYREVKKKQTGHMQGIVGYGAIAYAIDVHFKKGTLKGKPRSNGNGNYWDPYGEPLFLKLGFERDGINEIRATVRRNYKVSHIQKK